MSVVLILSYTRTDTHPPDNLSNSSELLSFFVLVAPLSLCRAIVRHCVCLNGTRKEFACNLCPRTYSTMRALRFHQRIECNQEPRFSCESCDYKTLRRTSLQRHMLRHRRDRPD
ncbi:hypothetical protein KPH14_002502 [Odynerus spinipes]|uniref:C2H2-type domain-containing protein n=1 Tax=Odynerus spinipes TaxID=1348599 RepID=A0AAD9RSA4_9HYME|nr:hypothetical protein KPH14_002502 [Odynerus spinipes]